LANCYNQINSIDLETPVSSSNLDVRTASQHLYEALSHHRGNLDFGANDPLVRAIVELGDRCRHHDDAGEAAASKRVWEELSHHATTLDLGADDPVIRALSEYTDACRREGPRSQSPA
jgi:hypothetical protein